MKKRFAALGFAIALAMSVGMIFFVARVSDGRPRSSSKGRSKEFLTAPPTRSRQCAGSIMGAEKWLRIQKRFDRCNQTVETLEWKLQIDRFSLADDKAGVT